MLMLDADVLTNAAMWAGIVGFLTPLAAQFITKLSVSRQVQAVLAFLFVLAISVPTAYFADSLTTKDYVKSALIVFTVAMASYEHFWKPLGATPSTTAPDTARRDVR